MLATISAESLRQSLPYPALIAALETAFQDDIQAPARHVHVLSEQDGNVLALMPAWKNGGMMGVKLFTSAPANPERGLPTLHYLYILYDAASGTPLAMLDGEELTKRRTGATSALAARFLARPDSSRLLMVGSGALAPYMAAAHCAARPIRHIQVWGRDPARTQAACAAIAEQLDARQRQEISIAATSDLQAAAAAADIISCATGSKAPLLLGAWLRPGTHVDLVGGFKPDMREADDELMARATVFIDTPTALSEAGDLVQALASGRLQRAAIAGDLADLAARRHPGRTDAGQITVFKSVGAALEDLCAATLAWSASQK